MPKAISEWLMIVVVIAALIFAQTMDREEEEASQKNYCYMVELWDSHAYLQTEDRPGWALFQGRGSCSN